MPEETNKPDTKNQHSNPELAALEAAYQKALAAFKAAPSDGPQKKDLRRARSAAKKAWDEALLADTLKTDPGAKALHCRDCSQMFVWTTEDQNYYQATERMWNHQPARCRACAGSQKARRKQQQNQNQNPEEENEEAPGGGSRAGKNMCYAFQRGECRYGDRCKFNHDPNFAGKNSEIEDDKEKNQSTGDDDTESGETTPKKRKIAPEDVPICKWGTKCTMKKCRYRHVDEITDSKTNESKASDSRSDMDSEPTTKNTTSENNIKKAKVAPTGICKWGKNCRLKRCRLRHEDVPSSPSEKENSDADSNTNTKTDTNTDTNTDTDINTKSNSDSNSDSNSNSNSSRPPACSREELLKVRSQLSPDFCPMARKEAFLQSCSITQATKCVDSSNWVEEYYQELYATRPDEDFLAFSVGCNKGFDALQTLRMGTYDTSLNKKDWRSAMQHDGKKLSLSVCKQDSTEEFQLPLTALQETGNEVKLRKGEMHCFEPMPQTVSRLKHSASTLGYDKKGYTVINSAVSKEVGTALFSSAENINRDGLENVGLATCKRVEERKHCSGVDMTTLKDYVAKHIDNKSNNKSNNNNKNCSRTHPAFYRELSSHKCLQEPGELLLVPNLWYHEIYNVKGPTIGIQALADERATPGAL
mmetsp:Transcript_28929/g.67934  ORF Transcript_28929/g.67934 Transcript_28929/m.67934 type:complete len:644 (-) Transcript_28929:89-2020(-)